MSIHPKTNTLVSNRWCIYSYFCSSTYHQVLCDSDSTGIQESSGGLCRVLEESGEFWKVPECFRMFKKSSECNRRLWNVPEYSSTELFRRNEIIRERSRWSPIEYIRQAFSGQSLITFSVKERATTLGTILPE